VFYTYTNASIKVLNNCVLAKTRRIFAPLLHGGCCVFVLARRHQGLPPYRPDGGKRVGGKDHSGVRLGEVSQKRGIWAISGFEGANWHADENIPVARTSEAGVLWVVFGLKKRFRLKRTHVKGLEGVQAPSCSSAEEKC